jgi:hypothetical protein
MKIMANIRAGTAKTRYLLSKIKKGDPFIKGSPFLLALK